MEVGGLQLWHQLRDTDERWIHGRYNKEINDLKAFSTKMELIFIADNSCKIYCLLEQLVSVCHLQSWCQFILVCYYYTLHHCTVLFLPSLTCTSNSMELTTCFLEHSLFYHMNTAASCRLTLFRLVATVLYKAFSFWILKLWFQWQELLLYISEKVSF
jgi:hypothetical protein